MLNESVDVSGCHCSFRKSFKLTSLSILPLMMLSSVETGAGDMGKRIGRSWALLVFRGRIGLGVVLMPPGWDSEAESGGRLFESS